ncbi:MAG: D-alanyl-D-alanine carboxypeptidase family protein [Oscillospiraceae bacterium]|nr:D-alanyl-D-alanine carboxypeptidase family protein [Oscillospiraceae bacterium]
MSKPKKSKAVPVVIVLTILFAALTVGCFYAKDWVSSRQAEVLKTAQEEAEEHNREEQQKYAAAMAEFEKETSSGANLAWPAQKTEGWDLLDLTNYPLESPSTIATTRSQIMNNGLLLVNQWHSRPEDFDESTLVGLGNYFNWAVQVADASVSLFPVAADALKAAIDAAAEEDLTHYYVPEAYRSWDTQNQYFQNRVEKLSSKYSGDALIEAARKEVNYPGTSEYNSGLSFRLQLYDRNNKEITNTKYSTSSQGIWMNTHCWEYGFVFRFPLNAWPLDTYTDKSFVTGINSQMNLYRYVGKGSAAVMHAMDFCLEEYIQYMEEHPHVALFEDGQLKYEIYRQYVGDAGSFDLMITSRAKSYVSSLDNMGGVITVFEY